MYVEVLLVEPCRQRHMLLFRAPEWKTGYFGAKLVEITNIFFPAFNEEIFFDNQLVYILFFHWLIDLNMNI